MANPSPRPLAEMMRSARRQYTALFMLLIIYLVGQVAGAFYLEDHPELPRGLWYFVGLGSSLPFMLFAIGYGIYGLVTGRFKRRAENVLVMKVGGEPAFVMPHTSGSQILLNAAGAFATVQLGQHTSALIRGPDDVSLAFFWFFLMMIIILAGGVVFGIHRGSQRLVLTAAGLRVPTFLGSRAVAWTALAPGGPLRPSTNREGIWVRFYHHPYEMRFFSQLVHQGFVADVIRYYVEHPEHRAEIGTAAEHDRLLSALVVPAASSAGVTVG